MRKNVRKVFGQTERKIVTMKKNIYVEEERLIDRIEQKIDRIKQKMNLNKEKIINRKKD